MAKPETIWTVESNEFNKTITSLKLNINWDIKKFETLQKDSHLKSALNKIASKSLSDQFSKCEKEMTQKKLKVESYTRNILKDHRDLVFFITTELWLPYSSITNKNQTTFSKLSPTQKIHLLAIRDILWNYNWNIKNINSKTLVDSIKSYISGYSQKITESVNSSLKWFLWLTSKSALKDVYNLTDIENQKLTEYLKFIEKHPEYVWGKIKPQEAWWWSVFILLIWIGIWIAWYYSRDKLWKVMPETKYYNWETQIEHPEDILRLLTQEANFSVTMSQKKEMFSINEKDWFLVKEAKKLLNIPQSKEIEMRLEWKLALMYDLWKWCEMNVNHNTWTVKVKLHKPWVTITETKAKVIHSNSERWQLDEFKNAELELENQMKEKAINEALNRPTFYEEAKEKTKTQIFNLLKNLHPYWVDIKNVEISYYEDESPLNLRKW